MGTENENLVECAIRQGLLHLAAGDGVAVASERYHAAPALTTALDSRAMQGAHTALEWTLILVRHKDVRAALVAALEAEQAPAVENKEITDVRTYFG